MLELTRSSYFSLLDLLALGMRHEERISFLETRLSFLESQVIRQSEEIFELRRIDRKRLVRLFACLRKIILILLTLMIRRVTRVERLFPRKFEGVANLVSILLIYLYLDKNITQ